MESPAQEVILRRGPDRTPPSERWLLLCQGIGVEGCRAVECDASRSDDHRALAEDGVGHGSGVQEPPDAAREVALEATQRFAAALALGLLAGEVGGRLGVEAAFADGEPVQRAVELAVAAAVEPVAPGLAGGGWDRCRSAAASELGVAGEAADAGDLADQLRGGQRAA